MEMKIKYDRWKQCPWRENKRKQETDKYPMWLLLEWKLGQVTKPKEGVQVEKSGHREWLGEDIGNIVVGVDIGEVNVGIVDTLLTNIVPMSVDVLNTCMKMWILC